MFSHLKVQRQTFHRAAKVRIFSQNSLKVSTISFCRFSIGDGEETPAVEKLKVVIYDRPCDTETNCSKCRQELEKEEQEAMNTHNFEMSDDSNLEQDVEIPEHDPDNEEYLEEVLEQEVSQEENTFESMPQEIREFAYEVKEEPSDLNPYNCLYCDKTFVSRSGRDTHQQLKHKCPNDFDPNNITFHETEIEADGKPCIVWQCPRCGHYSKKKDHHRTHMVRHAIRDKEETIKQETDETCFVLTNEFEETAKEEVYAIEEIEEPPPPAPEPSAPRAASKNDCHLMNSAEENLFFCSECFSKFPDEEHGLHHVQRFGSTGLCTSCVCSYCNVIFSSEKLFKRHQGYHALTAIAHHLNYFDCLTCSVVFSNRNDLDAHLKVHVGLSNQLNQYQYKAKPNTKLEGCELQLQILNEEWMETGRMRCAYCSKVANREAMNLHMTFFHANLFCPFDRQEFSRSLGYFVEHMKAKHPEEFNGVDVFFKCPFCEENFPSLNAMKVHCKTCQEKRISCNHCDKKFFHERQLRQHLNLVNGKKNHKCDTCGKTFFNKTELNVHQRTHSNVKPYHCTFPGCTKAFRTNSHRSSHMDTHSNSENYQCSMCTQRFKTRGARRIHEKSHVTSVSTCSLCLKEFRQRSHLIRHVKLVHRINCSSSNLEQVIGTQIQKVESSTVDVISTDDSNQ